MALTSRSLAIVSLVLLGSLATRNVAHSDPLHADPLHKEGWTQLSGTAKRATKLHQPDNHSCVPRAVFNALQMGMENPRAARAAAKLKSVAGGAGPNLEAADATYFFRFVPRVVRRPSVQFAGRERLTERGTYPRDLAAMIGSVNELAGGPLLRGGSALRQSGEGDEAFLARIHGRFVRSLSLKMPVVIAWNRLDFPAAAYDDLQQDLIPDDTRPPGAPRAGVGQFGHAVTATAVSPIFRRADGRPYFTLQHFDQQQSRWLEHHLFVEHANHRVYQTREADEFPPADQRVAMIGAEGRAVTPVLTMSTHLDGSFRLGDRHRYQLLEQMYASDKL